MLLVLPLHMLATKLHSLYQGVCYARYIETSLRGFERLVFNNYIEDIKGGKGAKQADKVLYIISK